MNLEKKVKILLVDDSEAKLAALESVLAGEDRAIYQATSGDEALKLLLTNDFAVILLDVFMPRLGGFETAGLIRQRKNSAFTPIIFVTATSPSDRQIFEGYAYGAVDYLFTPVPPDVLRSKVAVFVDLEKKSQEVRQLNQSLEKRALELEQANDELEAFSYSVSHDLRAPLRHINGFVDLLHKHLAAHLDEKAFRYLKTISQAAKQMGALIDDLLAFSRVNRAELTKGRVNTHALVDEVIGDLSRERMDSQVKWVIGDLPDIQADRSLMRQVWFNLLSNALKYSKNREHPQIEIAAPRSTDGQQEFFVKDNGVGFDMQYGHKLFGVFQRLHSCEEFEGTGIGLANVRRIVSRHGGRTWAEGKLNEGATFHFSLPRLSDEEPS